MLEENQKNLRKFRELDWRLNMVTNCRAREKVMVPKYTIQMTLENEMNDGFEDNKLENLVLDVDYANMKRI